MKKHSYELKICDTEDELKEYYSVRAVVFVQEQGVFQGSDLDEHDAYAIPIIARDVDTGSIVGAVRCYPVEPDHWFGGRLAVLPDHRGRVGPALVRKAVEVVQDRGCRRFSAYIQEQNVKLFNRLGWQLTGESVTYCGKVHQVMEIKFQDAVAGKKPNSAQPDEYLQTAN